MHKVERKMESNDEEPEVPLAQRLAHHPARHLRIPIVEGAKERSDDRTHQHIVKVSDHEIGSAQLPVEWRCREHDTRQSRHQELKQKRDAKHHRDFEDNLSTPKRRQPVEDFDPRRHRDHHRRKHKEGVPCRPHPDCKHMVRPNAQADKADPNRRRHHRRITKDSLARKHRDDLVDESERRKHKNVDLGMTEDPEEMHPQHSRTARLRVKEMRSDIAVQRQHDLRRRQRTHRNEDQAARHQHQPHEQRHARQLHPFAAHADCGRHDV